MPIGPKRGEKAKARRVDREGKDVSVYGLGAKDQGSAHA